MKNRAILLDALVFSCFAVTVIVVSGCGKTTATTTTAGSVLKSPEVTPPMKASLPTILQLAVSTAKLDSDNDKIEVLSDSRAAPYTCSSGAPEETAYALLSDAEKLASTVYCRLFAAGPIQVLSLTTNVDTRMTEYKTRVASATPACLSKDLVDKSTELAYPGQLSTEAFTQKYLCLDEMSATHMVAFGYDATTWWVYDSQKETTATSSGMSSAWRVTVDSADAVTKEEGYMTIAPALVNCSGVTCAVGAGTTVGGSTMMLHALVDVAAKTVELTGAGTGIGFCAFHMKNSADYIAIKGQLESGSGCGATVYACLKAADYSVATSTNCLSLSTGYTLSTLDRGVYDSTNSGPTGFPLTASSLDDTSLPADLDLSTFINFTKSTLTGVTGF